MQSVTQLSVTCVSTTPKFNTPTLALSSVVFLTTLNSSLRKLSSVLNCLTFPSVLTKSRTKVRSWKTAKCCLSTAWAVFALMVNAVGGYKSSTVYDSRFVLFQNDPDVYDVYYDSQWIPLKEATWRGTNLEEAQVTDALALAYLISSVKSENLRFYYIQHGDAPVLVPTLLLVFLTIGLTLVTLLSKVSTSRK